MRWLEQALGADLSQQAPLHLRLRHVQLPLHALTRLLHQRQCVFKAQTMRAQGGACVLAMETTVQQAKSDLRSIVNEL